MFRKSSEPSSQPQLICKNTTTYKNTKDASRKNTILEINPDDVVRKPVFKQHLRQMLNNARISSKKFKTAHSSVAKRTSSKREVWEGFDSQPVKSAQCRQRLATVATFPRSYVTQTLSRRDATRYTPRRNNKSIWKT